MSLLKRQKSIAEIEEEKEREVAEISLLEQKLLRKQLEGKMGSGGINAFKGNDGQPMWSRVKNWLKTH